METLAYLHHACAYEASESSSVEPTLPDGTIARKVTGTALIRVLSLIVSLSILSLASVAQALQLGDQGTAVSTLQTQLQETGCFTGAVDGRFGPQTEQAVKCWQSNRRLTPDGIVGAQTQATLTAQGSGTTGQTSAAARTSSLIRPGESDGVTCKTVCQLQMRLTELNYFDKPVTGYFGAYTVDAVKQFQTDRGLAPDGIVGAQTYKELGIAPMVATTAPLSTPTPPIAAGSEVVINQSSLRVGASGAEVEALQTRLKALGFFNGPVTGYYGPVTQAAVMRYQQSRGLQATGTADTNMLNSLNAVAVRPSRRYVVVVPKEDHNTLARVKRVVPSAVSEQSRLGEFVKAGTFFDRDSADRQSAFLRGRGLDARVAYR